MGKRIKVHGIDINIHEMRINNEEGLFQLFLATNEHGDRYKRSQFRQTHNTSESAPAESRAHTW